MSTHKTEIIVRFGDTDMAGVVYLPRYIHFFIVAWEEFFRSIGVPFDKMIKKEIRGFPPVEVNCRFKAPALCGDRLEVYKMGGKDTACKKIYRIGVAGFLVAGWHIIEIKMFPK